MFFLRDVNMFVCLVFNNKLNYSFQKTWTKRWAPMLCLAQIEYHHSDVVDGASYKLTNHISVMS